MASKSWQLQGILFSYFLSYFIRNRTGSLVKKKKGYLNGAQQCDC